LEQVCSANMATEQAVAKAQADRERLDEALAQVAAQAGLAAERDRLAVQVQHYSLLKQKYAQKSAALKEVRRGVCGRGGGWRGGGEGGGSPCIRQGAARAAAGGAACPLAPPGRATQAHLCAPAPSPPPPRQAQERLAAKDAEIAELMAMCDQLLAQQEAARSGGGAAAQP
jgi:hypothetical protein